MKGRNDARPGLTACLKALQPGNTLVLWKLDRLGRDLRHLVNTVEDLRVRGIGLKVLAGSLNINCPEKLKLPGPASLIRRQLVDGRCGRLVSNGGLCSRAARRGPGRPGAGDASVQLSNRE
jgi:hypothetical protein